MKRLLISIFTLCLWAFSLHAQSGEFDPANPGDPQPYYSLTVQVSPAASGTVNITRSMMEAGQEVSLRITPNKDFKFQQWVCGEEVLSSDTYLYYTMPARNVTITAQLVYDPEPFNPEPFNPESPDDPQGQGETAKKHLVTVYTSPSVGGYVSQSAFYMEEGAQQRLPSARRRWPSASSTFSRQTAISMPALIGTARTRVIITPWARRVVTP